MFQLRAEKHELFVEERETAVSGCVNACEVQFLFGEGWEGLTKTAVFRAGGRFASVLLGKDGRCSVPWTVLRRPWKRLYAGVYGLRGEKLVLPTVWADLGPIAEGAAPPETDDALPEPSLYAQLLHELQNRGDRLTYDGETLSLCTADGPLSSVTIRELAGLTGEETEAVWEEAAAD